MTKVWTDQRTRWSSLWASARRNMPRIHPNRMGSPTVLRMLLGYNITPRLNGKNELRPASCGLHCHTAWSRGVRPRCPDRRRILEMLAGPDGTFWVKVIALREGYDLSKWPYWPDGKGNFTNVSTQRK